MSPPHSDLQSEQWLSRGPRARGGSRPQADTAMISLEQRLSQFLCAWSSSTINNGTGRERQRRYRVPAGNSALNPQ